MKCNSRIVSLSCIMIALCLLDSPVAEAQEDKNSTFELGALLPLSGNGADQGQMVKTGIDIAVDYVKRYHHVDISVRVEDTRGDTMTAVTAYRVMKTRFPLLAAITWGSGIGVALNPIINQNKIIQFGVATSTNTYRIVNDYSFRNYWSADYEADVLAAMFATKWQGKRIKAFVVDNEYGEGLLKGMEKAMAAKGINFTGVERFTPGETDFRAQVTKTMHDLVDLVYLCAYPTEAAALVKQMRALGVSAPIWASLAIIGSHGFFELAGDAAEGITIIAAYTDYANANDERVKYYVTKYQEQFHTMPSLEQSYAARGFDAVLLLADAYVHCKSDNVDCIRDYLFEVRDYQGAGGNYTFDRAGDVQPPLSLLRYSQGSFVQVKE